MTRDVQWSQIPTAELLAELVKRQDVPDGGKPECGGSTGEGGTYDTALHVGALILIFVLSTSTCGLPLISQRSNATPGQKRFVFYCQHIGTGVLLATAFVHLLPMAFMSLTNPCLPDVFSKHYTPMAGLVAMVAALAVVAVESYLSAAGAGHAHSHSHMWEEDEGEGDHVPLIHGSAEGTTSEICLAHVRSPRSADAGPEAEGLVAGISPRPGETPAPSAGARTPVENAFQSKEADELDEESDIELDAHELGPDSTDDTPPLLKPDSRPGVDVERTRSVELGLPPQAQNRLFIQCLLLEAGILFHSLFIGMALSVATGPTFVVFLIAIVFHTSFEGLALGTRIAAMQLPRSSLRPWLMVLAFGLTTPIGQAIGLVIHNMYDPHSQTGLLLVGFMNAISSGLLLFAGLVQLLAEDFLTEKSYKTLKGRRRLKAFGSVVGGALLMAAVRALA